MNGLLAHFEATLPTPAQRLWSVMRAVTLGECYVSIEVAMRD
jgi:hypothetical protein